MRNPDMQKGSRKAWLLPIPEKPEHVDHSATIVQYLVEVPGAHPHWNRWYVGVVHLRPIEGQSKPAYVKFEGASHELMIMALDPAYHYTDDPDFGFSEKGLPFLQPIDVVQQFTVRNDDDARKLVRLAVRAILDGYISPDQDYRRAWATTIASTAAHIREGRHDYDEN